MNKHKNKGSSYPPAGNEKYADGTFPGSKQDNTDRAGNQVKGEPVDRIDGKGLCRTISMKEF